MQRTSSLAPWGFVAALAALVATPVRALEVRITPETPQLGDTLSILVETDPGEAAPQVTMRDKTYPTFAVGEDLYRALLPTTPLDAPGRVEVRITGETQTRNFAVWVKNRSFPTQRIWLRGGGNGATEIELSRVAEFKRLLTPQKFWQGSFLRPSGGRVSTIYGVRRYYNGVFANNYYHRGVDYAAPTGTPVVAPAAGRVALVGQESQGFRIHGNTVGIDHGQGVLSIFLHLNSIDVKEGDFINAGQRLGTIGSTGASTGPHLHWGLYVNGQSVDPVPWRQVGVE